MRMALNLVTTPSLCTKPALKSRGSMHYRYGLSYGALIETPDFPCTYLSRARAACSMAAP